MDPSWDMAIYTAIVWDASSSHASNLGLSLKKSNLKLARSASDQFCIRADGDSRYSPSNFLMSNFDIFFGSKKVLESYPC